MTKKKHDDPKETSNDHKELTIVEKMLRIYVK